MSELQGYLGAASAAAKRMDEKRPQMAWRDLPYTQDAVVKDILDTAKVAIGRFENFVLLGIGGSALGPMAVQRALNHRYYNDLPKERRGGLRLFVEDNVDPERMEFLLDVIDVEQTLFNVVSKSGSTSETMAQLLIITEILRKKLGDKAKDHVIATTDEKSGNLLKIARQEGYKTFYVPNGVGGRFSEFCPVGLVAAAMCGIDIEGLLKGAAHMDERCKTHDIWKNPAYMGALLQYIAMRKGRNISVMIPYTDALQYISDWYAQLWAESLGKRYDLSGKEVFAGQTPVKALGVTDQHSQIQLYVEGPQDKVVTFIGVDNYRAKVDIPNPYPEIDGVAFLAGHTLNELINVEQLSTEYALTVAKRPNQTIWLPEVNAHTLGQLLYLFEVQTAFAGELMGINTFDQPGVEEGKNATYAMLGKQGYDEKRAELRNAPVKNPAYVI